MCIKSFIQGEKSGAPASAGNGRNRGRISSPLHERKWTLSKQSRTVVVSLINVEKGLKKKSTTEHLKTSTEKGL